MSLPLRAGTLLALAILLAPAGAGWASSPGAARSRQIASGLAEAEQAVIEGRLQAAESMYRAWITELDGGRTTLPLARCLDGLAGLEHRSGRLEAATVLYRRSAGMWESLLGSSQPRLATTLHNLGLVYLDRDRPSDAEPLLLRALDIWEGSLGVDCVEAQNTRRALARARTGS